MLMRNIICRSAYLIIILFLVVGTLLVWLEGKQVTAHVWNESKQKTVYEDVGMVSFILRYYDTDYYTFQYVPYSEYTLERARYLKYRLNHISEEEQRCVEKVENESYNKRMARCYATGAGLRVGGGCEHLVGFSGHGLSWNEGLIKACGIDQSLPLQSLVKQKAVNK